MCTALANRAATQEEATGLFVAAARGLGCECRTVVALNPVPLRANAAALEKAGILLPPPKELWLWLWLWLRLRLRLQLNLAPKP